MKQTKMSSATVDLIDTGVVRFSLSIGKSSKL